MNQESKILSLLRQEEGVRHTPYIDNLGYPTVGVGFRLGPPGASLSNYEFTLNDETINVWLNSMTEAVQADMLECTEIYAALEQCNQARKDILISMAYQMGITGLKRFHQMLSAIAARDWAAAADNMLDSIWAKQTPARAQRHASVMSSGCWEPVYIL